MTDDTLPDFDDEAQAPAHLKGMITAEIDVIRDIMQVVQMFLGETMVTGVILLQELENKEKEEK
ncbi:hypothetical protein [Emticicia sp. C21]|uniref:hypothetical protein n=1 Tax=Emticicia sp. C21 TaxID=2302915 RepID=UPI000E353367|nr:hypothetical protein [Emticicia sp. C21]RFS15715.1 hypothetical protein D0T08_16385 [Emticicia sp. C21]